MKPVLTINDPNTIFLRKRAPPSIKRAPTIMYIYYSSRQRVLTNTHYYHSFPKDILAPLSIIVWINFANYEPVVTKQFLYLINQSHILQGITLVLKSVYVFYCFFIKHFYNVKIKKKLIKEKINKWITNFQKEQSFITL